MKRPLSVTIVGCVFVAAGLVGLAYHVPEFNSQPFHSELIWAALVRLLAVVSGVYILRGRDWARWLALAWMAFHVVLSGFHSAGELAMHAILLAAIGFFLLRPPAAPYFRSRSGRAARA